MVYDSNGGAGLPQLVDILSAAGRVRKRQLGAGATNLGTGIGFAWPRRLQLDASR